MKKLIVALTVLAMVSICLSGFTAFAAPAAAKITMNDGKVIPINIVDDFSSYAVDDDYYTGSGYYYIHFGNGKVVVDLFEDGGDDGTAAMLWGNYTVASPNASDPETLALYDNANWIGFHVVNTATNGTVAIALEKSSASNGSETSIWSTQYTRSSNAGAVLVTADGVVPATNVAGATYRGEAALIPDGFDGWLFFPFDGLNEKTNKQDYSLNYFGISGVFATEDGATLTIDDYAIANSMTPVEESVALATPFDAETNLKVAVAEDFANFADTTVIYRGIPDGPATFADAVATGDYSLDNGKLVIGANTTAWVGFVDANIATYSADATGFGFYVKNDTGADASYGIALTCDANATLNGNAYWIGSEKPYALVDMNGQVTQCVTAAAVHPYNAQLSIQSSFVIPADFEGYVVSYLADYWKAWSSDAYDGTAFTGFGTNTTEGITIDNLFFFGENVVAHNENLVGLGDEEPSSSADLSVIAYAAAAIVGCGALVIGKKRA